MEMETLLSANCIQFLEISKIMRTSGKQSKYKTFNGGMCSKQGWG